MKTTILIGGLFLSLLIAVVVVVDLVRIPNMYEVTGTGEIKYAPDQARIRVSVIKQADIADDASQQVAASMAKVIDALKAGGISDADISSDALTAHPTHHDDYGNEPSRPKLPAYTAKQTIMVIVHDFSHLGDLTSSISSAGANSWEVTFEAGDKARLDAGIAARKAALANAIGVADSYAADGGFVRGRILKLLGNDVTFPQADFEDRDYELANTASDKASAGMSEIVVTAEKRSPRNYVIPKPEPLTADASVDVLFEIK